MIQENDLTPFPSLGALFDYVSVTADLPQQGCPIDPESLPPLEGGLPEFPIGVVNEAPRNPSEYVAMAMPEEARSISSRTGIRRSARRSTVPMGAA